MLYKNNNLLYDDENEFERFKLIFTIILQKLLYKFKPKFTFLDSDDKEPFDYIVTVNNEEEICVKFRVNPTKTDLDRINTITMQEEKKKHNRTELYIHQKNTYNRDVDLSKYDKKAIFTKELSSDFFNDRDTNYIFWGKEILDQVRIKYPVDYYIYYDSSIELNYEDINFYSNQLKESLKYIFLSTQRKYSFVLGAGVSADYNIPMWTKLLNDYIIQIKKKVTFNEDYIFEKIGDSSLIKAQFVVDNFSNASSQSGKEYEFCRDMKKTFYSGKPYLRVANSSLTSIVKCIEHNLSNNDGVITYNYDDLLEETFNVETELSYQTIYKDDDIENQDVNIYHVHGFLPRHGNLKKEHSESIVLSEQKYNYLFNNPLSWQISNQLTRFRENLCLLVGLSISDPSLRRLLENVKLSNHSRYHYAILPKKSNNHTPSIKDIIAVTKHFERIGIHIIWVDDYSDIPKVIDSLYV